MRFCLIMALVISAAGLTGSVAPYSDMRPTAATRLALSGRRTNSPALEAPEDNDKSRFPPKPEEKSLYDVEFGVQSPELRHLREREEHGMSTFNEGCPLSCMSHATDFDATTVTALLGAAIAFNFFVLANL